MFYKVLRRFRKRHRMSTSQKENIAPMSVEGQNVSPGATRMEKSPISNKKASNKRKPGLFFKPQRLQFKKKLYSTQTAIIDLLETRDGLHVVRKRVEVEDFKHSEVKILKALDHPRIVKFFDYTVPTADMPFHNIFMEYVPTDLYVFQDKDEYQEGMPETIIRDIFAQLLEGVHHLHSLNICHRDLKPENVLITENNKVKLADFGHAAYFTPGEWFKKVVGTFEYMPPEVVLGESHNHKVDQWALGAILLTLFNHVNPFLTAASHEESHPYRHKKCVEENIVFLNYHVLESRNPSATVWDLVHLMLRLDPQERQECIILRNHKWFALNL